MSAGEWREAQHEEGTLKALVVHDQGLELSRDLGNFTLADARPGPWRPQQADTRGVIDPGGEYDGAPETLTLRCSRGGYPVPDGCEFVVEDEGGTVYGWDNPTMIRSSQRVLTSDPLFTVDRTRALVPLPDGRLLWVGDRDSAPVPFSAPIRYLPSDEWAHDARAHTQLVRYPYPESAGEARRATTACALPSGRVLCAVLMMDRNNEGVGVAEWRVNIGTFVSQPGESFNAGGAFQPLSEASAVAWFVPGTELLSDVHAAMAYSGGQVLLMLRAGANAYQFASRDDGATFELVDTFTIDAVCGLTVYGVPGGGFVVPLAFVGGGGEVSIRQVGSAFTSCFGVPEADGAKLAGTQARALTGFVTDTGEHHILAWTSAAGGAEQPRGGVMSLVSYDGGASFNADNGELSQLMGRVNAPVSGVAFNQSIAACWQRGRAFLALDVQPVDPEADPGDVACVTLGGFTEVPVAVGRAQSPRDRFRARSRMHWTQRPTSERCGVEYSGGSFAWFPHSTLPAVRISSSATSITAALMEATPVAIATHARTMLTRACFGADAPPLSGQDVVYMFGSQQHNPSLGADNGSAWVLLVVGDGAGGIDLVLRADNLSGAVLASATIDPGKLYEVQVYHRARAVVVYYREHDLDERAAWTLLFDGYAIGAAQLSNQTLLDQDQFLAATTDAFVSYWSFSAQQSDRTAYTTGLTSGANLTRKRGRRLAPVPTYITGGLTASMSRGPAITGQEWQSAPSSASFRAASWTAKSPSPSRVMRLAPGAGARDLRWTLERDTAYLQPPLLGVVLVGSHPAVLASRMIGPSSFDASQTLLRFIRANVAIRRGDTITITERGDPITFVAADPWFVAEDELVGGYVYYDAPDITTRRRIVANSAGVIGGAAPARYAHIRIEAQAGDPTTAGPWFVVPRLTAHILPIRDDAITHGLRLTSDNDEQELKALIGWLRYLGEAHGDDSVHTIHPRAQDTETEAGYRRRRQMGVPYREVELSWQQTTERAAQLWAAPPDVLRVANQSVGSRGEYSTTLAAWFARWASQGDPVAYFPAVSPTGGAQDFLTRQQGVPLVGTIDSDSWEVQDVGGVELRTGERRNGRLLIRELT